MEAKFARELRDVALKGIIDSLRGVKYLRQVVVSVSGTDSREDFEEIRRAFDGVRTLNGEPATMVWNGGPALRELYEVLRAADLDPLTPPRVRRAFEQALGNEDESVSGRIEITLGDLR